MTCRPQAPPGNLEWQQNSSKPTCLLRYFGYWQEKMGKIRKKDAKVGGKEGEKHNKIGVHRLLLLALLLACYLNAQMGLKPVFFFILLLMVSDLSSAPGSSSRLRCCRDPNLRIRADPQLQTGATTPMQAPQIFFFLVSE